MVPVKVNPCTIHAKHRLEPAYLSWIANQMLFSILPDWRFYKGFNCHLYINTYITIINIATILKILCNHAWKQVHAGHASGDISNHKYPIITSIHMLVFHGNQRREINGVRQSSRKKSENFLLVNKHIICNAIHRMKNQKVQVSTDNQWISKIILSSV